MNYELKKVIGLTGMSGAGKSSATEIFREHGFHTVDCDKEARAVISRSPCIERVGIAFPNVFTDGILDRKKAASLLFSDREKLEQYQKIVFPYVVKHIMGIIEESATNDILLDAPTLYQSGANSLCNTVIAIIADESVCVERIVNRDNISESEALLRLRSQPNQDFFCKNADYVVENNLSFNEFYERIVNLIFMEV